ncbi:histidine kinase/DNA gyrase B/HSP90-like ATPase [Nitrosospira sp. Nsp2]|uniref:sensor histidine kinase n=1 Tax=Nitrosospira sp. Nsp2 TaxID=136548 RepID=UPI000D4E6751|nr:ATP-binding protein [Nitrosospira sp. Nsp2]PTR16326.1 histidine kinase/DNA gyrase B/HSP90-like ATPase [Nitrosospira sp. Nsp2]
MISKNVATAVTNGQTEEPASVGKALRERFKEITALYESRRRMGPELPLDDICRQIFDHLIPAMHFPVMASAMIELDGRCFTSGNYRDGSMHELQSNIAVLDRLCGHLRVFYPDNTSFLLPEEQELVDAIACDLERWLKEIECLYEIRRGSGLELPLEDVCQKMLENLIPVLQFPESAAVVIELEERRFAAARQKQGFTHELHSKISAANKLGEQGTTHQLRSNITVNNRLYGHLGVLYPEDTPFLLPDEQKLIDALARELERWLKEVNCLYEIRRGAGLQLSLDDVCQEILKHLIPALEFPESATVVIELDDRRFATPSHEQGLTHELHAKINADNTSPGQLRLFYPLDKPFLMPEEQRLIDALAAELGKWLEAKKINETLRKRLEEITCLYEIRRTLGRESSLDNACHHIVRHLVAAMRFPEMAIAMIELDDRRYSSENQAHVLTHELRSNITANKRLCGQLRVFYPEDNPFLLPEEQRLIDAVARDLERWLEGKRQEQTLVSIAEQYQHTIGRELHDNLGQEIAALGYQAEALEQDMSTSGNAKAAKIAASIARQAQGAVGRCKELAQGLLPFELETHGLVKSLQALSNRVADAYKISCEFIQANDVAINDNEIALNFYRTAQEAVSNAIRHGGAHHIVISLGSGSGMLYLSICDDGSGISNIDTEHGSSTGVGIKIMHYRARQLGAALRFLSRPEGGTEVRLEMRMVQET